jgi:hypothetical protein
MFSVYLGKSQSCCDGNHLKEIDHFRTGREGFIKQLVSYHVNEGGRYNADNGNHGNALEPHAYQIAEFAEAAQGDAEY